MARFKKVSRKGFAAKHAIHDDDMSYVLIGRRVYLAREWTKTHVLLVRQPEDAFTARLRTALQAHYADHGKRVPRLISMFLP